MKMLPPSPSPRTVLVSRLSSAAAFLSAALLLAAIGARAQTQTQYIYDGDDTTIILRNYPNLSENFVSGGSNGVAATGNRFILQNSGNLYVNISGDPMIAGSGFESMEVDGGEWLIGGAVTLTGTSATTFHVVSGECTIGGPMATMGWVIAANGSGPKTTIDASATLTIGFSNGSGNFSTGGIVDNGSLVFARSNYAYGETISGAGNLTQSYSALTLSGSNSYSGGTFITGGTIIATNAYAIGTGGVDFLTSYCTLAMQLATPADVTFNNKLTGNGCLLVNLGSGTSVFSLGDGVGNEFNGSLYLRQGTVDLSGANGANGAAVLANSSVGMVNSSKIIIGSGTKNLGNLTMGGAQIGNTTYYSAVAGALAFNVDVSNPAAPVGSSLLSVGNFTLVSYGTLGSSGTIFLANAASPATAPAMPASGLFEQDDANIITQLIAASGSVSANASDLALRNANGAALTNAQTRDVAQGVNGAVATATYDYRLTTGPNNDGLYVNYGLTNLELLSGKTLELINSGSGGLAANTLGARFTGAGNLDIKANGAVWLNGVGSTYTGTTTVSSGLVIAGENRAFGNTVATRVKSGARVDLNSRLLSVGQSLVTEPGSSINIDNGYLLLATVAATTADTIIAPDSISGAGTFRIQGNSPTKVVFEGDNPSFAALLSVAVNNPNFSVIVATPDALGTGTVSPGYTAPFYYTNITGTVRVNTVQPTSNAGFLIFQSSTVFLTGNLRGNTNLVNTDATFGPTAGLIGTGTVTIDSASTLRIGLVSQVTASNPLIFDGGTLDFVAPTRTITPRVTINDLRGSGTIWVNANPNTGDSNIITFKKTAGDFALNIRMMEEARTAGQIMPIYSTGTDSAANITLANGGEVDSGVYVFKLVQGTGNSIFMPDTNMWYLANDTQKVSRAAQAIVSTAAVLGADWHYSLDSVSKRAGDLRREFEPGEKGPRGNFWARAGNQSVIVKDGVCGEAFDEDIWVFNAGADMAFRLPSATAFAGIFGGVGNVDRTFTNLGAGTSYSISAGLYATWLHKDGWFADVVGKDDMIKNEFHAISSDGSRINGKYNSGVLGFSVEAGKQIYLNRDKSRGWWLEPGIQAACALLKSDDYATDTGIKVHVGSGNSQQYRAQLRFGFSDRNTKFRPYAKAAAVYVANSGGTIVADTRELQADYGGLRIEAGLGGSYIINKTNQVYLEYEYAHAGAYQRKWSANLGYRHAW